MSPGDGKVGVLENALRASGGLDLSRLTRRFIVHMSAVPVGKTTMLDVEIFDVNFA